MHVPNIYVTNDFAFFVILLRKEYPSPVWYIKCKLHTWCIKCEMNPKERVNHENISN